MRAAGRGVPDPDEVTVKPRTYTCKLGHEWGLDSTVGGEAGDAATVILLAGLKGPVASRSPLDLNDVMIGDAFLHKLADQTAPTTAPAAHNFLDYVGLLGFLLALASLSWQVWSYFFQWKPRLKGDVGFLHDGDGYNLRLRVWNAGRVSVHLSVVELVLPATEPQTPPKGPGPHATFISNQLPLIPEIGSPEGAELPPGTERFFQLPDVIRKGLFHFGLPTKKGEVYISVRTPAGEVLRLDDDNVYSVVGSVMAAYRPKSVGG